MLAFSLPDQPSFPWRTRGSLFSLCDLSLGLSSGTALSRKRATLLMPIMKAVELQGEIDDQHRLHADVPQSLPAGSVRVIVLISEEDEGGPAWAAGVSSEWSAELNDPAQDLYTLNDGQPIDAPR